MIFSRDMCVREYISSVSKKSFRHAAHVFETFSKFQKLLISMVRDTLLGFPSHSLPYRYRKSYHFIDSLIFFLWSSKNYALSQELSLSCRRIRL